MKIKDLLTEDEFDDDGDVGDDEFAAPEYTPDEEDPLPPEEPITGATNPDVWHREDNINVGRIVDRALGVARTSTKLRGALIAWVKETSDPDWQKALRTISDAVRRHPEIATRLQGCRTLTQAALIAQRDMATWDQF